MMQLSERAKFFEAEHSHNTEVNFTVQALQIKILSGWASQRLGFNDSESQAYMRKNIANITRRNMIHEMLDSLQKDFARADVDVEDEEILQAAEQSYYSARDKIMPKE